MINRRSTQLIAFAVASLIAAAPALADESAAAAKPITATIEPSATAVTATADAPHRSPTGALLISLGATAVGYGTVAGGIALKSPVLTGTGVGISLLGPTAGHWYAGRYVTGGLITRGVGVLLGVALASGGCKGAQGVEGGAACGGAAGAGALFGGAFLLAGGIYDLATAPRSARRFNAKHAARATIAPTALQTSAGIAPGLAVVGSF